jgi:hypothetical protein
MRATEQCAAADAGDGAVERECPAENVSDKVS